MAPLHQYHLLQILQDLSGDALSVEIQGLLTPSLQLQFLEPLTPPSVHVDSLEAEVNTLILVKE